MAGTGKAPRENNLGHRSNDFTRVEPAAGVPDAPAWPLGEDLRLKAKQQSLLEQLADVNGEIDEEQQGKADARRLGGLRRKQSALKDKIALVDLELEFATTLEVEIWEQLWQLPQAQAWRSQGWLRDVAQYARHKAKGEGGSLDDAKEARMWSDRLGLSPSAAARMGLTFKTAPAPAAPVEQKATGTEGNVESLERRRRLKEG